MSRTAYGSITDREIRNYRIKLRRQREIRTKIITSILAFLVVVGVVFFVKSITSSAVEEMDITYKYFKSYEIEQGDSLWSIAEEYIDYSFYDSKQEYIEEVMQINHLNSDIIVSGQCLVVPYFSCEYH